MSEIKLKGYLYFMIEKVNGLPVFGQNGDRVDSYVSVFLDDMEEGSTNTIYDDENPEFNKLVKVKVNGYYETCSLQVLNSQPKQGWSDNLGQVILNLADLTSAANEGKEQQHSAVPLTLRPQAATGDATKDNVQGTVTFVTKYRAYKKKKSKAERQAEAAKAKAEAEAERQKQLEAEKAELEARLEAERKVAEAAEAKRLAAAKAVAEKEAREKAEAEAAAAAAAAKVERERREAAAKAELERKAAEQAKRAEELRVAQEKERAANEARQRMLLETQKQSKNEADKAAAEAALDDLDDGMYDAEVTVDDILAPPRGPLTCQTFSKQKAPTTRLPGTVTNISAGKNGNLYAANATDKIYCLDMQTKRWKQIPGRAICLAAAPDGTVWCANRYQRIYELQSNHRTWKQIPGNFQWIGVGSKDHVWALDMQGRPSHYQPSSKTWDKKPGQNFQRIAAGDDGEVWAVSKDQRAYRWDGKAWHRVPGLIKDVAVQNQHCIWAASVAGGLYEWQGNHWRAIQGAESYHTASVSKDGAWAVNGSGRVYFEPPPPQPKLLNSTVIATMGSNGSYVAENALDSCNDSFYWGGRPGVPGDMFMIMLMSPVVRQEVSITTGKPAGIGGADGKVTGGRVEISFDGRSWTSIGAMKADGTFKGGLPSLPLRGIRLMLTRPHAPIAITNFALTGIPDRPATQGCSVATSLQHHGDFDIFKAIDNDIGSYYWSGPNMPRKGDYLEVTFNNPVKKSKLLVISGLPDATRDYIENASIEVSTDGMTYTGKRTFSREIVFDLPEEPITSFRIEFEANATQWVAIREIAVV